MELFAIVTMADIARVFLVELAARSLLPSAPIFDTSCDTCRCMHECKRHLFFSDAVIQEHATERASVLPTPTDVPQTAPDPNKRLTESPFAMALTARPPLPLFIFPLLRPILPDTYMATESTPKFELDGFSLHVSVRIAPSDVGDFFAAFQPAFEAISAEPECLYFEVFQDPDRIGKICWIENWSTSPEWYMKVRLSGDRRH